MAQFGHQALELRRGLELPGPPFFDLACPARFPAGLFDTPHFFLLEAFLTATPRWLPFSSLASCIG